MFVFVFPSADIVLVRSIRHALLSPFSAYKKDMEAICTMANFNIEI